MIESLKSVSDTAWWTAAGRFLESNRDDALFKDPLAGLLIEGHPLNSSTRTPDEEDSKRSLSWSMAVRTKLLDDLVMELVNGKKVDAIVNLACGLCTRVFRLPLPQDFRWVEVDFNPVIEYKKEKLSPIAPPCQLEFRSIDLRQPEARQALLKDVSSYGRVAVITEGLLLYLPEEHVAGLAKEFLQYNVRYWLSDFYVDPEKRLLARPEMYEAMKKADALFRFNPAEKLGFFAKHGWRLQREYNFVTEGIRLNRVPDEAVAEVKEFGGHAYIVMAEPQ